MKELAFSIGTYGSINAPKGIPEGGIFGSGSMGQKIISLGVNVLFVGAILIAFAYLLMAGIQWITSEGDKTKVEAARHKITFAIIGLIIVFMAFFIVRFVGGFFGADLLTSPLPISGSTRSI